MPSSPHPQQLYLLSVCGASGLTIMLPVSAVCVFFLLFCENSIHTRFRVCPASLWPHLNVYPIIPAKILDFLCLLLRWDLISPGCPWTCYGAEVWPWTPDCPGCNSQVLGLQVNANMTSVQLLFSREWLYSCVLIVEICISFTGNAARYKHRPSYLLRPRVWLTTFPSFSIIFEGKGCMSGGWRPRLLEFKCSLFLAKKLNWWLLPCGKFLRDSPLVRGLLAAVTRAVCFLGWKVKWLSSGERPGQGGSSPLTV